ncbi:uracil-DNA glycosylase [Methylomonas methanica]|uniref:Type-4 uracil-DNA glycosylase n=1 Tax=Methylomonas methanica (strain DSM 25384 / MC09) TaxID=857087 RepID=G0A6N5_METMM|nr:uracil-DNA glycosylase [Methylomonas methanica]AEF99336.1 phage SPO1 DNA polymerase-related protein [Methylomonas methanica MC09]
MDNATRLQYLEAMGIDVWVPRRLPVAALPAVDEPENIGGAEDCRAMEDIASGAQAEIAAQSDPHKDAATHHSGEADFNDSSNVQRHLVLPSGVQAAPTASNAEQAWIKLQQQVAECRACGLCETRTQTVFGVGSHHASWMLIGEAPGQNEDLQGEPFVGKAGQLLNEMLRAIGLAREEVFIANVLKCRPPANRDPQAAEVAACHDFLRQQIALMQPKIILAVGRIAAQNLLNTQQPLAKLRGRLHSLENIPLVVVHHPAYLLRALTEKAKAWDDLQFALSVYQSLQEQ